MIYQNILLDMFHLYPNKPLIENQKQHPLQYFYCLDILFQIFLADGLDEYWLGGPAAWRGRRGGTTHMATNNDY